MQTEEVQTNPYTRDHQEKIVRFQQETVCACIVLDQQFQCTDQLLGNVGPGAEEITVPFEREREASILKECKATIRNRIQSFEEMNEEAAELISWVSVQTILLPHLTLFWDLTDT